MSVWSESGTRPLFSYSPHPSFVRDLLPFFTQYALSVRLWSPDSSAFALAGAMEGRTGIWVQPLAGPVMVVTEGTWVAWSTR